MRLFSFILGFLDEGVVEIWACFAVKEGEIVVA